MGASSSSRSFPIMWESQKVNIGGHADEYVKNRICKETVPQTSLDRRDRAASAGRAKNHKAPLGCQTTKHKKQPKGVLGG